jgi:RNA polymerase-binding transcription factor DksA
MDDVQHILQEELQHVVGRLRDLGGAFMVDDSSGVLDDDDEVTEAGAGAAPVEGEREITFSVRSRLLERANRLADALERVRSGEYGTCDVCGCAIAPARLRAMPEVTTCVACQDAVERVTCRTGSGER